MPSRMDGVARAGVGVSGVGARVAGDHHQAVGHLELEVLCARVAFHLKFLVDEGLKLALPDREVFESREVLH